MQEFDYSVKTGPEEIKSGHLIAKDKEAAIEKLLQQGYYVLSIKKHGVSWYKRIKHKKPSLMQAIEFYQRLQTYIRAGMELLDTLELIYEEGVPSSFESSLKAMIANIKNGSSFSSAAEKSLYIFDNTTVQILKASEASGDLDLALTNIIDQNIEKQKLRNIIKEALIYPIFVLCSSFLLLGLLMAFVLPRLTELFVDMGTQLPWLTRLVFAFVAFSKKITLPLLFIFALGYLSCLNKKYRKRYAAFLEKQLWKNKRLAKIILLLDSHRFVVLMSSLLKSDISLQDSLSLSSSVVISKRIKKQLMQIRREIVSGANLSDAFDRTDLKQFVPVPLLKLGEKTGDLAKTFQNIASSLEQKINSIVSFISRILEPSLIVIVGLLIGVMVISLILPVLNITNIYI